MDELPALEQNQPLISRNQRINQHRQIDNTIRRLENYNRQDSSMSFGEMNNQLQNDEASSAKKNNLFQIRFLICSLIYLQLCISTCTREGNVLCNINYRDFSQHALLIFILPVLLYRIVIHQFKEQSTFFGLLYFIVEAYTFVGFGFYILLNILKISFLKDDPNCFTDFNIHMFNFFLIIVFGLYQAVMVAAFITLFIVLSPCLIYALVKSLNSRNHRNSLRKQIIAGLQKIPWNSTVFSGQEECAICLLPYDKDSLVTPLPCDKRHYFHTQCIQEWVVEKQSCPFCKTEITPEALKQNKVMI